MILNWQMNAYKNIRRRHHIHSHAVHVVNGNSHQIVNLDTYSSCICQGWGLGCWQNGTEALPPTSLPCLQFQKHVSNVKALVVTGPTLVLFHSGWTSAVAENLEQMHYVYGTASRHLAVPLQWKVCSNNQLHMHQRCTSAELQRTQYTTLASTPHLSANSWVIAL
jgi:hypothetical protein